MVAPYWDAALLDLSGKPPNLSIANRQQPLFSDRMPLFQSITRFTPPGPARPRPCPIHLVAFHEAPCTGLSARLDTLALFDSTAPGRKPRHDRRYKGLRTRHRKPCSTDRKSVV